MSVSYDAVEFVSALQLRLWLEANHASVPGVWAVTYKKAAGERHFGYESLVRELLCFGWIDGQARGVDELRTSLLITPRRPGSGWSRPNKIRIAELEPAGLLRPAGIAAIERAKADGSWTLLDSVEDLIEPDDLRAALDAVPAARAGWDASSASTRKLGLMKLVMTKRPATRAKWVASIVAEAAGAARARVDSAMGNSAGASVP